MSIWLRVLLLGTVATVLAARPLQAEISAGDVRKSIQRGVAYLKSRQNKATGGWVERAGQKGGVSALCTLALLNAGVPTDDADLRKALEYLRGLGNPERTYSTALQTMVFCQADPERDRLLIRRNVEWLERIQLKSGDRAGAWGYYSNQGNGDNSNSQFALLALHEAERVGVAASAATWRRSLDYWQDCQRPDGSFGYTKRETSTGSMTCAGIACLVIASGRLGRESASATNGTIQCCGNSPEDSGVERGLLWLGEKFSVYRNPTARSGGFSGNWLLYYLYGVERVGRLTGRRFIGRHDWYREGAEMLVAKQDGLSGYWKGVGQVEETTEIATSLALLFLSKGRRPIVISKLRHDEGPARDWDRHSRGVPNLTQHVQQLWKRELTWQTIDADSATAEDLLETPVLFMSGQRALNLTREQQQNLKEYVNRGGFLFVEACSGRGCNGQAFDASFRQLMKQLFPTSPLRLLPPDHPVWYAERQVDPRFLRPLYGIDACCRTSVVYCPETLSCLWELGATRQMANYPADVRAEVEANLNLGANVLAYATNRRLKEKLDRPAASYEEGLDDRARRGTLYVPKLTHGGGGDDAPNALVNLLAAFGQQAAARVAPRRILLAASDSRLFEYPILFMHGRRDFRFSAAERRALGEFIRRGGFVFADAICASPEFATAFRREWSAILTDSEFRRVPPNDPLFTRAYRGFDVSQVTVRDPKIKTEGNPLEARLQKTTPWLDAMDVDGRLAVVLSPLDLSCALENQASLECKGYVREDAARLGINILLYALSR